MIEGWLNDDYLILFNGQQESLTERYSITNFLPGYTIVGLTGWNDFILKNKRDEYFTVPTVPVSSSFLQPLRFTIDPSIIKPDTRFSGKIKWYIQPLVFGGDPEEQKNTTWLSIDQHVEAVKWWNHKYREIKGAKETSSL